MATRRNVVAKAVEESLNPSTANTQYGHWKRATFPGREMGKTFGAKASPASELNRDWSQLLKNGFTYGADWILAEDGTPMLDSAAPEVPGIYVLVREDQIVYIGMTTRTLANRMADYRRGHSGQKTSARVRGLIIATIAEDVPLRLLFATPEPGEWNGLEVDVAVGLEPVLIHRFQPIWNKAGIGKRR